MRVYVRACVRACVAVAVAVGRGPWSLLPEATTRCKAGSLRLQQRREDTELLCNINLSACM